MPYLTVVTGYTFFTVGTHSKISLSSRLSNGTFTSFEGELINGPLDFSDLVTEFISNEFQINLPIPNLSIDEIDIRMDTSPEYYELECKINHIENPFHSFINKNISFREIQFTIQKSANPKSTVIQMAGMIELDPTITWFPNTIRAGVIITDLNSIFIIKMTGELNPIQTLANLFGFGTISPDVQNFLPVLMSRDDTTPMLFYYAKNSYTSYAKGMNIDSAYIRILSYTFGISLNIDNGFIFAAKLDQIDFGFIQINNTKILIVDKQNQPKGILLTSTIVFLPNTNNQVTLELENMTYQKIGTNRIFSGTIAYLGNVFGITNPSIGISWSDQNGFSLDTFPLPESLKKGFDIAKLIEEASKNINPNGCGDLVDFAFKNSFETDFTVSAKPVTSRTAGKFGLSISGTYVVKAFEEPLVTVIFDPISFEFTIPKSLDDIGNAIASTVSDPNNWQQIVSSLYNDKAELAKLISVLGLRQASESLIKSLVCRFGNDFIDDTVPPVDPPPDIPPPPEITLEFAAESIIAAIAVIAFLLSLIDWFKKLTGSQDRKKKEAEERKRRYNEFIQQQLFINSITLSYQFKTDSTEKELDFSWSQIKTKDDRVYFELIINNNTIDQGPTNTTYTLKKADFQNGVTYSVSIQALFRYKGDIYPDDDYRQPIKFQFKVPILATPVVNQTYDSINNKIFINWNEIPPLAQGNNSITIQNDVIVIFQQVNVTPLSKAVNVNGYLVQLLNNGIPVSGFTKTITAKDVNGKIITNTEFDLTTNSFVPNGNYVVSVIAIGDDTDFNSLPGSSSNITPFNGIGHMVIGTTFKIA